MRFPEYIEQDLNEPKEDNTNIVFDNDFACHKCGGRINVKYLIYNDFNGYICEKCKSKLIKK